jgi:hypothetical protein
MVTIGATVYPVPGVVIETEVTTPLVAIAVAIAWVPPAVGAEILTVGATV